MDNVIPFPRVHRGGEKYIEMLRQNRHAKYVVAMIREERDLRGDGAYVRFNPSKMWLRSGVSESDIIGIADELKRAGALRSYVKDGVEYVAITALWQG